MIERYIERPYHIDLTTVADFLDMTEEDGTLIMYMNTEDFKENILSYDYAKQKEKYGNQFDKVWKLASDMNIDDNPILIIAKR